MAITICSWNMNGWRSCVKNGSLEQLLRTHSPDIVCLQELKLSSTNTIDTTSFVKDLGYNHIANIDPSRPGYSGTAILYKKNLHISQIETYPFEGRIICLKLTNGLTILNVYTPNSGQNGTPRLDYRITEWDPAFRKIVAQISKNKKILICGDLNVARTHKDVANSSKKHKQAGYTPQERASFEKLLTDTKLVDLWRYFHTDEVQYTYWSYLGKSRERNVGWRIDYFLTNENTSKFKNCHIVHDHHGSDHAPLSVKMLVDLH